MGFRDAMYHAMMGENLTGKQAAEKGMVNESLPADKLKDRVQEVCRRPQEEGQPGAARDQVGRAPGASR